MSIARINAIYDALRDDPEMAVVRRKLSVHDIRLFINHAAVAFGYCEYCSYSDSYPHGESCLFARLERATSGDAPENPCEK